jgi:hypothetical protein
VVNANLVAEEAVEMRTAVCARAAIGYGWLDASAAGSVEGEHRAGAG